MKYKNFYHRYFEGYQEEKYPDKNGKMRITRTYTGFFYEADLTGGQKTGIRIGYLFSYLLSCCLLIAGASLRIPCNMVWYCGLVTGISLLGYAILAVPMLGYLFRASQLTIYEYCATSKQVIRFCRWTSWAVGILTLLGIGNLIIVREQAGKQILALTMFAGAAVLLTGIWFVETHLTYKELYNDGGDKAGD